MQVTTYTSIYRMIGMVARRHIDFSGTYRPGCLLQSSPLCDLEVKARSPSVLIITLKVKWMHVHLECDLCLGVRTDVTLALTLGAGVRASSGDMLDLRPAGS